MDDNARALLLSSALLNSGEAQLSETITARFAAFIQHAWNPDTRRFRNFMSYDRRWLEESGSEDSHGRTLWALAECARQDTDPSRRRWAAALFKTALPAVEEFSSPRAWAFSLLGLDAYCAKVGGDLFANRMRRAIGGQVDGPCLAAATEDWVWFEDVLAYDNARLPQALIQTGLTTQTPAYVEAGLAIAALAHVASDHVIGILQAGRDQELRQTPPEARSVRSAARRGVSNDFSLPCCLAGGWRRGVAGRERCARLAGSWAKTTCKRR